MVILIQTNPGYINRCLPFYHLKLYLRGEEECEIGDIGMDDMFILRKTLDKWE